LADTHDYQTHSREGALDLVNSRPNSLLGLVDATSLVLDSMSSSGTPRFDT